MNSFVMTLIDTRDIQIHEENVDFGGDIGFVQEVGGLGDRVDGLVVVVVVAETFFCADHCL